MLSFPWDKLKAETLRTMCKDLGAGPAIKRTKEDMVQFLKNIENRGLTAVSQEGGVISKTATIASGDAIDEAKSTKPVAKLPTPSSTEEIHDMDTATSDSDMGSESSCHCQEGWLSPRMKFILSSRCIVLIYRTYLIPCFSPSYCCSCFGSHH
ncbi:hypothetical protein PILCRDRAFT_736748 [Piloderma croceum F 1598]|uniref:Uncharacterized protein n=1 Tax=Piloderma croceum (strain F 1598) TaxID=765440 RepID=A0A0C3AG87_PILCF|nr:hypothetical protein PILCRDRAFT_736748 [Piloderma croceum F 1598]